MLAPPAPSAAPFVIRLGRVTAATLPVPCLGGQSEEALFPDAEREGGQGRFSLYRAGAWRLGHGTIAAGADLEIATKTLYADLFAAVRGHHLCRIWNYVSAINQIGANGLENYRAFSRGRSLAFEDALGPEFKRWLPAASAVGSAGEGLFVTFAAHENEPAHRENPRQMPAYDYPAEHGPRAPSFARASVVHHAGSPRDVFISGTSAIEGHTTVAAGNTLVQLQCTLENLRAIGRSCGLGADLAAGRCARRHLKVYLRHPGDHELVARTLDRALLHRDDTVIYLAADICRAALNVEIEVTVFGLK